MSLSERERRVIVAVAAGEQRQAIADSLDASGRGPIDETMRVIRRKYGALTSAQAVVIAMRRGDVLGRKFRAPRLNAIEERVLHDLAKGMTGKALCEKYFFSESVLDKIIENIQHKLGAVDRENAMFLAVCCGLLSLKGEPKSVTTLETDVLLAYIESKDTEVAALKFGVSKRTFAKYLESARGKLNARNTVHAVALALHRGDIYFARKPLTVTLDHEEILAFRGTAIGLTQAQIAKSLKIGERKVNAYLASAMQKIGARHLAHGVVLMFQGGYLK